jgi:hypothetical protein
MCRHLAYYEPGWTEVPPGSVVTAAPQQVSVADLAALATSGRSTAR